MVATVYWSVEPFQLPGGRFYAPERVLTGYHQDSLVGMWGKCPAVTSFLGNVFMFRSPRTSRISLGDVTTTGGEGQWAVREEKDEAGEALNVFMIMGGVLLFSEASLIAQWTPPYFHPTNASALGALVPGAMDIGKWFRPLQWEFQLWRGAKELRIAEGEPLAYLQVLSEERVDLQPFVYTQQIHEISRWCTNHKDEFPRKPLSSRYADFERAGWREILLSEIHANLL